MSEQTQIRWQCRRGMRELDILLERYLENVYANSSADDKSAFQQLLKLSDPDLAGYLLRDDRHSDVLISNVIDRILGRVAP